MKQLSASYANVIQKVYQLALLQIHWLFFTIIGAGVFGVLPATHTLIEIMKQKEERTAKNTFSVFWQCYWHHWRPLNMAGLVWLVMFLLMGMNMIIFTHQPMMLLIVCAVFVYMLLSLIYFLLLFQPAKPILKQIYHAFAYGFAFPKNNLWILFGLFILYVGIQLIPGMMFFFGVSVCIYFFLKLNLQLS